MFEPSSQQESIEHKWNDGIGRLIHRMQLQRAEKHTRVKRLVNKYIVLSNSTFPEIYGLSKL